MVIAVITDFTFPLKSPVMIFCLVLTVILIVPFLVKKLKIPDIIGLITAGISVGILQPVEFSYCLSTGV